MDFLPFSKLFEFAHEGSSIHLWHRRIMPLVRLYCDRQVSSELLNPFDESHLCEVHSMVIRKATGRFVRPLFEDFASLFSSDS